MIRSIYILLISLLFIACGTQQKTIKNSSEETTSTVNTAIIDSVNAQHDKVTKEDPFDAVDTTKEGTDGYINDDGESVTVETVLDKKQATFSHEMFDNLLKKHVSNDGKVNYKGFKKDWLKLQTYIAYLGENMPVETWSKNEKLAYWINAYNAFTIDLILDSYPAKKGIKKIRKPWKQRRWKIDGKWYNLDEIEHDILRKMDEPRIHFAINCASFSCPPLLNEAFTAEKLEQQLTQVTKDFVTDTKRNTITKNNLEISKIFKWFSKDFEQEGSLIDFLNKYSTIKISNDADIDYKDYDWSLNE